MKSSLRLFTATVLQVGVLLLLAYASIYSSNDWYPDIHIVYKTALMVSPILILMIIFGLTHGIYKTIVGSQTLALIPLEPAQKKSRCVPYNCIK